MSCNVLPTELLELVASYLAPREHFMIATRDVGFMPSLIKRVKDVIWQVSDYVHPDACYSGIPDLNDCNLDTALIALWNIVLCMDVSFPDPVHENAVHDGETEVNDNFDNDPVALDVLSLVCEMLTMESELPASYDEMNEDILRCIIYEYLDSEYDDARFWLGGYKAWKYIFKAIEHYPKIHDLDTIEKQKHCLVILIYQYLTHKNEIIEHYRNESTPIDSDALYFSELCTLIAVISGNGHLGTRMIDRDYFKNIFDFFRPRLPSASVN